MDYKKIELNGKLLAYIIRTSKNIKAQQFFGSVQDFLQVGIMGLDKGFVIKPHYHLPQNITVTKIQEVLIILSGKIEALLFDVQNPFEVESVLLKGGDILVLLDGGHGFNILAETKLIEVKQGPYDGQKKDKNFVDFKL